MAEIFTGKYTKSGRIGQWLLGRFFRSLEALVGQALTRPGDVLELGVGEGYSTRILSEMLPPGSTLRASELEPEQVELARARNPGVDIVQESIYALDRPDDSQDLVVCLEVLEHLDDPFRALQEMARVSRQWVIVSVPREPLWRAMNMARGKYLGQWGNTPGHIQHWSTRGLCRLVGSALDVTTVRTPIPWTMVLAKVPAADADPGGT